MYKMIVKSDSLRKELKGGFQTFDQTRIIVALFFEVIWRFTMFLHRNQNTICTGLYYMIEKTKIIHIHQKYLFNMKIAQYLESKRL